MSEEKYFSIHVDSLRGDSPTSFDLYVMINNRYVMYLRGGDRDVEEKINQAKQRGADTLYIPETQKGSYKTYVHDEMKRAESNVETKARMLRASSVALVAELFESPDISKALDESKGIITDFVKFMEEEPEAMAFLIGLSGHDFYTYQHSLDVSIYSLGIGQAAGYSKVDLVELGRGALFHDIGKRQVHVDIICKRGPLDESEWAQMQQHPLFGLQILNEQKDVPESMKACCFEHHENFLGTGYPQQLTGPEIHPMARIVALADTFDAMTTQRSYNIPMTPKEALNFMKEKLSGRFDPDLLKAFYSALFKMEQ